MEDDPKRPYKMYAAVVAVLTAVAAGAAVFGVRNPKL
jgi:hypothetical protein